MNKVVWTLQVLLALVFLAAGGLKLTTPRERLVAQPSMAWAQDFSAAQIRLIGGAEVLGAAGLVLPAATGIAPLLTPVAALLLGVLMTGAAMTHLQRGEPWLVPVMLIVLAMSVAVGRFRLRGTNSPRHA